MRTKDAARAVTGALLGSTLWASALLSGCAEQTDEPGDVPCGIRACTDEEPPGYDPAYTPPGAGGKADGTTVEGEVAVVTRDGVLDADDVVRLFDSAGDRVSMSEMLVIRDAMLPGEGATYEVEEEALQAALELARIANLPAEQAEIVAAGQTFDGGEVPPAVHELLAWARLHGAIAYDVNEQNSDGEGVWSPYPATTPPTDNMTFDYTLITPEILAADLADTAVVYNAIVGEEEATLSNGETYQRVRYEERVGGTGNVIAHYDHVYHPDIYARGRQNQKWANNCAILADGTFHCLPASRRSIAQNIILTNPHLSRGVYMLYNGHIDIRATEVTSVELSGRLSKRAGDGKAIFIDPVTLLEAWGFNARGSLDVYFSNTEDGRPVRDPEQGVIRAADEP